MTETDEKLSRMFQAQAPERDAVFADQVATRLKSALRARVAASTAVWLVLAAAAAALWLSLGAAWRIAAPVVVETVGPVRFLEANFLGAPAPALLLLALAGGGFFFRRAMTRLG